MNAKSSIISCIFHGEHLIDIITPWKIELDTKNECVIVSKRNKYLIGVDKKAIPFRNIRTVYINEHFFGADVFLKIYGGNITVKCLSKYDASKIYDLAIKEISNSKKGPKLN